MTEKGVMISAFGSKCIEAIESAEPEIAVMQTISQTKLWFRQGLN